MLYNSLVDALKRKTSAPLLRFQARTSPAEVLAAMRLLAAENAKERIADDMGKEQTTDPKAAEERSSTFVPTAAASQAPSGETANRSICFANVIGVTRARGSLHNSTSGKFWMTPKI